MYLEPSKIQHVYPVNDLEDHLTGYTADCKCEPRVEQNEEVILIIHNSFDGRENFEIDNPVRLN